MRGKPQTQTSMLSLRTPEERVPKDHPLRAVKALADEALRELSPVFDGMYSKRGRHSIPPERLLKATLLMALHSVRSERLFCEQLDYNLLYRWFLDMDLEERSFDHSTFSFNRERLMKHEVAEQFFAAVVSQAKERGLTSSEHFSADGTLIDAWASLKSFRPKDEKPEDREPPDDPGNPTVDFHGEKRSNETHESTTDPEAKLMRKSNGQTAKLSYSLNGLIENENGILVELQLEQATGTAERDSAIGMLFRLGGMKRITVGADKGYDTKDFVANCRQLNVTPHVAQNIGKRRRSAVDARTTSPPGYAVSQRKRKLIEEVWGWMKAVGGMRKSRFIGKARTAMAAFFVAAAYNLLRIAKLQAA
ncbi:MAG: IS5 family transposase [Myxococcaceae bacterium]|nr:IS5 family transposase [Myxococcaceae bacterium]